MLLVGLRVGTDNGDQVGVNVEGEAVGDDVGSTVGCIDGCFDGGDVGAKDGNNVGMIVEGELVGAADGRIDGLEVGGNVGAVGLATRTIVGELLVGLRVEYGLGGFVLDKVGEDKLRKVGKAVGRYTVGAASAFVVGVLDNEDTGKVGDVGE